MPIYTRTSESVVVEYPADRSMCGLGCWIRFTKLQYCVVLQRPELGSKRTYFFDFFSFSFLSDFLLVLGLISPDADAEIVPDSRGVLLCLRDENNDFLFFLVSLISSSICSSCFLMTSSSSELSCFFSSVMDSSTSFNSSIKFLFICIASSGLTSSCSCANIVNIRSREGSDQIAYFDVSELFSNDGFHLQQRLCLLVHVDTVLGLTLENYVSNL